MKRIGLGVAFFFGVVLASTVMLYLLLAIGTSILVSRHVPDAHHFMDLLIFALPIVVVLGFVSTALASLRSERRTLLRRFFFSIIVVTLVSPVLGYAIGILLGL